MLKMGNVPVTDAVHKMPTPANTERKSAHSRGPSPVSLQTLTMCSGVDEGEGHRGGRRCRAREVASGDGNVTWSSGYGGVMLEQGRVRRCALHVRRGALRAGPEYIAIF